MNRGLGLLWLLIFVGALVFIGQTIGLYDLPILHDLRLPLGVGPDDVPPARVAVAPSIAPSPSPVVRTTVVAASPCGASRLSFANGMADLKTALGARMGEP